MYGDGMAIGSYSKALDTYMVELSQPPPPSMFEGFLKIKEFGIHKIKYNVSLYEYNVLILVVFYF